jgi:hypothetical protein
MCFKVQLDIIYYKIRGCMSCQLCRLAFSYKAIPRIYAVDMILMVFKGERKVMLFLSSC